MSKTYSIAEARDQLPRLVHRAERGSAVELTRHGKPVAVILSKQAFEDLTRQRPSPWAAVEQWRRTAELDVLEADPDPFEDVRDRSPGRKVRL